MLGDGGPLHDGQPDEGLEAHHAVDFLTLVGEVIILRIVECRAVSDIGESHDL